LPVQKIISTQLLILTGGLIMIVQETVLVTISNNAQYYESLGYFIPKYKPDPTRKRLQIKRGTQIKVKVCDIPKGSNVKILCKCDMCGKERLVSYIDYRDLCFKCSKNSEEFKEKISKTSSGRKHSKETKEKISKNSYSHKMAGENHPNYNKNLTNEERKLQRSQPGDGLWIKTIKKINNYTCQNPKCGYIGNPNDGKMASHHLNNKSIFKEQRHDINNGICLCKKCHKQLHKLFGIYTTVENWNEFIK
jgi:hypothetical protein